MFNTLLKLINIFNKKQPERSFHFAHENCTIPAIEKDDSDSYTYLYQLTGLSDFMVENLVRGDNGEVIYCIRHIPTNRTFRFPKQTFEMFFRKSALLS